jgi:flagellar hook-associated protein 3 FlgL
LSLANTKVNGIYIFGGYVNDSAPFDSNGNYLPAAVAEREIEVEILEGVFEAINTDGEAAFKGSFGGAPIAGKEDLFDILNDLRDALEGNDVEAIRTQLDRIERAMAQISESRSDVGVKHKAFELARNTLQVLEINAKERLSGIEDADIAEAVTELTMRERALSATLAASARVIQPTLLNFLR